MDVQSVPLDPDGNWQRRWDIQAPGAEEFEAKLKRISDRYAGSGRFGPSENRRRASRQGRARPRSQSLFGSRPGSAAARGMGAGGKLSGYPDPGALHVLNRTAPPEGFENANSILINPPVCLVSGGNPPGPSSVRW